MIVSLSRPFLARGGNPVVDRVDVRIFRHTFFSDCMDCSFCFDTCCQYGATVEAPMVEAINRRADELEPYLGVSRREWFDSKFHADADYPGGEYTRTRVIDGSCVFLSRTGRGCMLHRFCLERSVEVHELKPMACHMFPVLWENGVLIPPLEVADGTLVCLGEGPTLYRSGRGDLGYYFGPELVAELDGLEAAHSRPVDPEAPSRGLSLPLIAG